MRRKTSILILTVLLAISANGSSVSEVKKLIEKCRAANLSACKKLGKIAKSDQDWPVVKAAIMGLSDESLLADIVLNSKSDGRRFFAVNNPNLTDQLILARVATQDQDEDVAVAALDKLHDEKALGETAKSEAPWRIVVFAARRLTDQSVLEDVARHADHYNARETAVWKVRNQQLLADIAMNDGTDSVVHAAVFNECLVDQQLLSRIAREARLDMARTDAIEKIIQVPLLKEIAQSTDRGDIRTAAEKHIKNLETIAKADTPDELKNMLNNSSWPIQKLVLDRLTDQRVIAEFAKTLYADKVVYALEKITDQSLICDVAENAQGDSTRENAVKWVTDEAVLARIARSDQSRWVRRSAVLNPHLKDEQTVIDVALHDPDDWVRETAVSCPALVDQAVILKISQFEPANKARIAAIAKLTKENRASILPWIDTQAIAKLADPRLVQEIALTAGDAEVRVEAAKLLDNALDLIRIQNIRTLHIKTFGEFDTGTAAKENFKNPGDIIALFQNHMLQSGIRIVPESEPADGTLVVVIGHHKTYGKTVSGVEQTIELNTGRVVDTRPATRESATGHSISGAFLIACGESVIYSKPFNKLSSVTPENIWLEAFRAMAAELGDIRK